MKTEDVNRLIEQRKALAEEALDEMVAENQRLGLYDDAVNMSQDRVDETAKGEHMIDYTDDQPFDERLRPQFVTTKRRTHELQHSNSRD